ncbi:MAG: type I-C CRISPR-associated protein Cas8c/Csd1, partial [Puniceicoccales bacterium]|nr:type I-C CRISPR-associated protein Cas8c/Csd1 [Puniceicoccales bacterium]
MIFPALHRFAQSRHLLDDLDFVGQTLRGYLNLDATGHLLGAFPLGTKNAPIVRPVSKLPPRNSTAIAALGADTASRVIPGFDPAANRLAVQTQALFLEQLRTARATITGPAAAALGAIITYLEHLHSDPAASAATKTALEQAKIKTTDWLTFTVDGTDGLLVEWQETMAWWRGHCATQRAAQAQHQDAAASQPCIVTGKLCTPVRTHGTRIKVAPGGLSGGVALVSCDKPAFSSYNFDKALVSPMSEEAVEAYIRAVNWLGDKTHDDHHHRTTDTIFLFWCDQPEISANPAKAI